jgi:hypothetical protein
MDSSLALRPKPLRGPYHFEFIADIGSEPGRPSIKKRSAPCMTRVSVTASKVATLSPAAGGIAENPILNPYTAKIRKGQNWSILQLLV